MGSSRTYPLEHIFIWSAILTLKRERSIYFLFLWFLSFGKVKKRYTEVDEIERELRGMGTSSNEQLFTSFL